MINDLIHESSGNANIEAGRPTLVALTRKTEEKIYKELVSVQPTTQPLATVYGMRYDYVTGSDNLDIQLDHRVGGGKYKFKDNGLTGPTAAMTAGQIFGYDDYVFEVIKAGDYLTGVTTVEDLYRKVVTGDLRHVADGFESHDHQDGTETVQDTRFVLNRWVAYVRSRKLKCPTTLELVYDMERQGLNADLAIEDLLATAIAEEINSDIMSKLLAISIKEPAMDLVSYTTPYYRGRELIDRACVAAAEIEWWTSFPATYVVASYKVAGMIRASGQVGDNDVIKGTNLKLFMDSNAIVDYMMVGAKYEDPSGGLDNASGLYYSPLVESDDAGSFLITTDYSSLQPSIGIITRYALSAFPSFADIEAGAKPNGDDWLKTANTSQFVHTIPVIV